LPNILADSPKRILSRNTWHQEEEEDEEDDDETKNLHS
jgi:hypothetical protein